MIKIGDWVEGDNGYGVIARIFPRYYQYSDDNIPAGKKIGDKLQDSVILKRFCSFDFKVHLQTRVISASLASIVSANDMEQINVLLKDVKILKRFESYQMKEDLCEVVNFDQNNSIEKIAIISNGLNKLEGNGNLNMTIREIESYLKIEFDIELINRAKLPNCFIQLLSAGLGLYRNNEMLFKKISILKK